MTGIYYTLIECVEMANKIDAAETGYVSLDETTIDRMKAKLTRTIKEVLNKLEDKE